MQLWLIWIRHCASASEPAIILPLCLLSWRPQSCSPCVTCLGVHQYINLVCPVLPLTMHHVFLESPVMAPVIMSKHLVYPSQCLRSYSPCVPALVPATMFILCPRLGACYHVYLLTPVLVPTITLTLCLPPWCPRSCLPRVSVLVPATMSTLCPCIFGLGAHHYIHLVSPP